MPRYDYRATDAKGQVLRGVIEADNYEIATDTLRDKGLSVVSLDESAKKSVLEFELPFLNKVSVKDTVVFSRQFSVLMGAKVPVVQSIKTVARQTQNKKLQKILGEVADEVESGTSLSMAMARYPDAFSDFFVNMLKSGETTGRLEEVMNYLADQMERDYDLMAKIKGAMTYPIIVLFGMVVIGFIMMTFVVPKLTETLKESGTKLPWATQVLIFVSDFMKNHFISIVIFVGLALAAFQYWIRTETGRRIWDNAKLFIPVFGDLLKHIYIVRITQSLGTLITSGVDIPASLEVTADIVGNAKYQDMLIRTRKEVLDGNSITTVFEQEKSIPIMVSQMMVVGESTGRLYEVLAKLTEFYSRELQNKVATLVSAIEPLIMLAMGGAVGVMVVAIMMPMYSMATNF
ncbi:MAG: type II secretion system F family protein [Patescibacteria group bacterium]|nr:type II secretion system F family protein [Patescibacteria group bacterium]